MSRSEEKFSEYFTDFDGKFKGRLSGVFPIQAYIPANVKVAPTTAKYDCRVKVEYHKDLMKLLEEGMLLAVRNFKSTGQAGERYTLMEITRIFPEHFGMRGLSDDSYYPLQFEIIDQSVQDWSSNDKSTMMIQISAIPVNYDLIVKEGEEPEYAKGFSYPVVGDKVHILNKAMINRMYNHKILKKMGVKIEKTTSNARLDPRLGTIKMFEAEADKIPIYVDFENLIRYHFGIFAFTGGGKSNLLSNILRRLVYHIQEMKIVIFDISCEYPFLLMDVFADKKVPAKIIFENPVESADQLYISIVKPRDFEDDPRVIKGLEEILNQGKVAHYTKHRLKVPTYAHVLEDINNMKNDNASKPFYVEALDKIYQAVLDYMTKRKLMETAEVDEEFVKFLDETASKTVKDLKISDKSNVYSWATTRSDMLDIISRAKTQKTEEDKGLTFQHILAMIEGSMKITCLSIADPYTIKELAINLSREFLQRRKRQFKVKPYVLFVFDEAQEFLPSTSEASSDIEKECTKELETLLRQGRKYGLGGCIATQRVAYMNTSALQQLHTYFVGTLPRPWDRTVVSSAFMIDQGILEKTLEFAPGEWMLSSYIATGMENIPIFIKADNTEEEIERFLESFK